MITTKYANTYTKTLCVGTTMNYMQKNRCRGSTYKDISLINAVLTKKGQRTPNILCPFLPVGIVFYLTSKLSFRVRLYRSAVVLYFVSIIDALSSVVFRTGIDDLSPIKIASVKGTNDYLGTCYIRCDRDIIEVAHAEKLLFFLVEF